MHQLVSTDSGYLGEKKESDEKPRGSDFFLIATVAILVNEEIHITHAYIRSYVVRWVRFLITPHTVGLRGRYEFPGISRSVMAAATLVFSTIGGQFGSV